MLSGSGFANQETQVRQCSCPRHSDILHWLIAFFCFINSFLSWTFSWSIINQCICHRTNCRRWSTSWGKPWSSWQRCSRPVSIYWRLNSISTRYRTGDLFHCIGHNIHSFRGIRRFIKACVFTAEAGILNGSSAWTAGASTFKVISNPMSFLFHIIGLLLHIVAGSCRYFRWTLPIPSH